MSKRQGQNFSKIVVRYTFSFLNYEALDTIDIGKKEIKNIFSWVQLMLSRIVTFDVHHGSKKC